MKKVFRPTLLLMIVTGLAVTFTAVGQAAAQTTADPPPAPAWQLGWLYGLLVMLLALAIFAAYRLRVRSVEHQRMDLANQVADQTRELAALHSITAVVSNEMELPETLAEALAKTLEVIDVDAGAVLVLDKESRVVRAITHQGLDADCLAIVDDMPVANSFLERVIRAGELRVVSNLTVDSAFRALSNSGFRRLAVVPLVARGAVLGALFVTVREPKVFTKQETILLSSVGGQMGVAIENSHLFDGEQHRAEQFRLIATVGRRFSSLLDIEQVLDQVVKLIQQTFGYYHVAIGLIEGDYVVYNMGAGVLWDNPDFDFWPARLRVGEEGITGWVAAEGKPLMVPDVRVDPRYVWMQGSGCLSELTVPVISHGEVIGVLDVQSDRLNGFDETDLDVIQALANQAGAAIQNARLYEQAQQAAVLEERARLARDLHDSVTQSIYSLTLLAEAGLRMTQNGDMNQVRENQMRIEDIAQQSLQEMRLLVYELRPAELKKLGLIGALERRLEVVERRAGIEARLIAPDDLQLPYELEVALYRTAQEALNNALKHARALAVFVNFELQGELLLMSIRDNGRGFEALEIGEKGGYGLQNMRERVENIGGTLSIESGRGAGTIVCVSVKNGRLGEAYE